MTTTIMMISGLSEVNPLKNVEDCTMQILPKTLLQQLWSLGYTTIVMGGGIIYCMENDEVSHVHVFEFLYGFGKGNHEKVASIIEQYTDVVVTFDSSDGLY